MSRGPSSSIRYALRPAGPEDLAALLEIHDAAFRTLVETRFDWDPCVQRDLVARGLDTSRLIVVDGETVGQLSVEEREDSVFLRRVMLHPRWQGRGLGRRIVEDLIVRAAPRPVTLSVWENNRARGLYERLGFRVTGREGFRIEMRRETDV